MCLSCMLDATYRWRRYGHSIPPAYANTQRIQDVSGTLPLAGEEIQELKHVFLDGNFREGKAAHRPST